eukprot:scaffold116_cov334-Pavlova_lutheri.AAC.20
MSQQRAGAKNRAWFRISGSRARGPSTPAWFRSLASRAGFYRAQDPAPRVLPYSDVHGRYHSSFLSLHVPSLHVSDGCSAFTSVSWSVFLPNARWNSILYHQGHQHRQQLPQREANRSNAAHHHRVQVKTIETRVYGRRPEGEQQCTPSTSKRKEKRTRKIPGRKPERTRKTPVGKGGASTDETGEKAWVGIFLRSQRKEPRISRGWGKGRAPLRALFRSPGVPSPRCHRFCPIETCQQLAFDQSNVGIESELESDACTCERHIPRRRDEETLEARVLAAPRPRRAHPHVEEGRKSSPEAAGEAGTRPCDRNRSERSASRTVSSHSSRARRTDQRQAPRA